MEHDGQNLTTPLNPAGIGWTEWICPDCGEDGDRPDLVEGQCPNCGSDVEPT